MSIVNYGRKLINDEVLKINSNINDFTNLKIWTPNLFESIVVCQSDKGDFESVLHFFWSLVFSIRETKTIQEAEEIFSNSQLIKTQYQEALEIISRCNKNWYQENSKLIPNAKWSNIIWQSDKDVFFTFEDEEKYYAFNWEENIG